MSLSAAGQVGTGAEDAGGISKADLDALKAKFRVTGAPRS